MSTTNSKQWSSATPGYIIFLVDQSGSMSEHYAEGKNKAEFTSTAINRTINELINTNMDGDKVKDRVFISIIGYGGRGGVSVEDLRSEYLSKFADDPIRIERKRQKISDGNGGLVEVDVDQPIFVEAVANGLTPMGDAFRFAKELIDGWMQKKPDNPAPVIINISDGLPYDGNNNGHEKSKAQQVAVEIMSILTTDGPPLVFNAHIENNGQQPHKFKESEHELTDDQAKFLFNISSRIPEAYKSAAVKHNIKDIKENSRGFVSNADPETLIQFINFGSSAGSGGTDRLS